MLEIRLSVTQVLLHSYAVCSPMDLTGASARTWRPCSKLLCSNRRVVQVVLYLSGKAVGPLGENNSLDRSLYEEMERKVSVYVLRFSSQGPVARSNWAVRVDLCTHVRAGTYSLYVPA
jgi:hypothetical protein